MDTKKDFTSSITMVVVFLFSTYFGYSQGAQIPMDKILYSQKPSISSPNAAALEKYVEFPVANYTGVPDISIPIHQIALKGLSLPIGLSYHASGIKVEEVASDVGIGWSVNTGGGAINILSNGKLDEISNYPLNDPDMFQKIKTLNLVSSYQGGIIDCSTAMMYADGAFSPDPYNLYSGTDIGFLSGVVRGTLDAEPDLYMFNFLGRSGKFFLDENAVFRTIPYSEIKIERLFVNATPAGYKLTDENGIIYEFKTKEESGVTVNNNSVPPWSLEYTRMSLTRSYNLSKITTPAGETVDFNYTQYPLTYDLQKIFSRATFGSAAGTTSCYQFNGYGNYYYSSSSSSFKQDGAYRIESIVASDGTLVKFLYSANDRSDLSGSKALEKIEIWSYKMGQKILNEFTLVQDYSTGRLTLRSLKESTKPATQFVYNSLPLPDRLSFGQDAYGFCNAGNNNTTLLPKDEYMEFWEGADRSVDPAYTQAGMLTKIIHPTGGSTEYVYEPNEFYVSGNTIKYPKVIGTSFWSQPNQTVSDNFTITGNSKKIRLRHTDSWDGTTIHNDYCIIHLDGPNNYHRDFVGNSNVNTPPLNLVPGQYTISIENVGSTYYAELTMFWFEETIVAPHNEIGGGVRIKEINKYDRDGNIALLKKFEYKQSGTNNSSGLINVEPIFTTYQDQNMYSVNNNNCIETYCQYESQSSNSIGPLTYANGSHVLYSEVTTYLRDKTQNGYSNYKYNVTNDGFNTGLPSFPYPPGIPYDWVNGFLLEQTDYSYKNNQFIPTKKIKNYYNYNGFDPGINTTHLYKTYGAKIAIQNAPQICFAPCLVIPPIFYWTTCSNISFGIQGYKYYSSWHRLDKTDETIYDENGANPLTTSVNYFYDDLNSIQQTRIEMVNSKGEALKILVKHPFDYTGNTVYDGMIAKNMIAPAIEQSTYKNTTTFLQSTKANYNYWSNLWGWGVNDASSKILPQTVETKVLSNSPETRQQINQYDGQGNILEIQKPNDVKEVYLYGYNSNYPVAKVIGSDLTTVRSFANQQILDNIDGLHTEAQIRDELNKIRTGLTNTKALVTTYTYKPFIGMSSETDPNGRITYYEYDALNRLILVRDKDNNILKKICYNYTGQPEDCTITCADFTANWQNTTTALRCQLDATGQNTGYQEQEQRDMNTCSVTYNQTRWIAVGQNTSACPLPVNVNLTSTNVNGISGYTANYYNTATGYTYNFSVPTATGLQALGTVPSGNYTLTISRTSGMPIYGTFKSGCFKQTITGMSAIFYNVAVSTTTCNSISVDLSAN